MNIKSSFPRRKSPDSRYSRRPPSEDRLWQQMSELISLREKVAQAELAAGLHGGAEELGQSDKIS